MNLAEVKKIYKSTCPRLRDEFNVKARLPTKSQTIIRGIHKIISD